MNKILIVIPIVVILFISVTIIISEFTQKSNEQFDIKSQQDLTFIALDLVDDMRESHIFLTISDILQLVGSDPNTELVMFDFNDMNGTTTGKGISSDGSYELTSSLTNGTRTYEQYSHDGALLKSITIHDVPDKKIIIIMKES